MKKVYAIVLLALGLAGIVLMAMSNRPDRVQDGQAGVAFTEGDDGELILNTGSRTSSRTVVPDREQSDGGDEDWLTKFVLTERSGKRISSEELKGQPYVAGFFFSTCPSICVRQNSKIQELQEKFKGQKVRFLSISCDPEVDRPEVLAEYAKRFDADADQWLFFTGKMNYIRRVGSEVFSLAVERQGHPEKFALMDANGKMFGLYTWSDEGQWGTLEADIERMIAAGGVLDSEEASVDRPATDGGSD